MSNLARLRELMADRSKKRHGEAIGYTIALCKLHSAIDDMFTVFIVVAEVAGFLREVYSNVDGSFYTKQVYEGAQLDLDKVLVDLETVKLT